MTNSNSVSSKTQTEVEKFYGILKRAGNIYLADVDSVDRAFNIIIENIKSPRDPANKGFKKL